MLNGFVWAKCPVKVFQPCERNHRNAKEDLPWECLTQLDLEFYPPKALGWSDSEVRM